MFQLFYYCGRPGSTHYAHYAHYALRAFAMEILAPLQDLETIKIMLLFQKLTLKIYRCGVEYNKQSFFWNFHKRVKKLA